MNGLLIVVAAIFLFCVFWGYHRGFIKIAVSLAATLITIILVVFMTPYISSMILKVFPIEKAMQEKCIEILVPKAEGDKEQALPQDVETSRETQISLLENAKLPEMFRQSLLENNNEEIYKSLGVTTFTGYVGSYLAKQAANIISFLLAMIVVTVIVRIITYTLGIIGKLPVIGGLNRLAGGLVGMGAGLLAVWVLFIIITMMYNSEIGKICFQNIADNKFLTELYNNNILMNFITKFRV